MRQCPLCGELVRGAFGPGPGGRPDASCPKCGSLERHRFLAVLLTQMAPLVVSCRSVMDVAPSPYTTQLLQRLGVDHPVRMDFDPGADGRSVNVQASLTDIPLSDASVDLMICFHVLEHIPDDRSAMSEIRRVLSGGGLALIQVPWRSGRSTDEDPSAGTEERIRRFGQADHVRYYGGDIDGRFAEQGLDVLRLTPRMLLDEAGWRRFHISPDEAVWVLRRAGDGVGAIRELSAVMTGSPLASTERLHRLELDELRADVERLRAKQRTTDRQKRDALARSKVWQSRYETLRGRAPVRVLVAVKNALRRVRG